MSWNPLSTGNLRAAYLPNRRVRLASDVASLCAAGLLLGLLGSAVTWWGRSDFFDLASTSGNAVKIGTGYLAGPVLILFALPLVFGRRQQVALKRLYEVRLLCAAMLWLAGLVVLDQKLTALDGYTLEAGAYVTACLLGLGLLATLAMWPHGLPVVAVDRNGKVRAAVSPAARPRERFPTGR